MADDDEQRDETPRKRRSRRSGALIGVLLALLGFALVTQVRSNDADQGLSSDRQEDLVQILDDLDARKERLNSEVASLSEQQREISSSAQGRQAALDEAKRRADELGILAGTLPAEGPGLSIVFSGHAPASVLLDAVEELRGAGAEAMQIAGARGGTVRVVASTSFTDQGADLLVDGKRLVAPYTVVVIGDGATMSAALNIPGGVVDAVKRSGGSVSVHEPDVVEVSATRRVTPPRYARPVS
jgi:uncharacterized protein YlxW (UPF0749 family)